MTKLNKEFEQVTQRINSTKQGLDDLSKRIEDLNKQIEEAEAKYATYFKTVDMCLKGGNYAAVCSVLKNQ